MEPQNLRNVINDLSTQETTEVLQARLDAAGLEIDLSSVPADKVSETFVSAMSTLLERSIGELTVAQIRSITAEVNATSAALETTVTADTILQGFRKLEDGVIELTLPVGTTIQEAGKLLNAAAKEKGMDHPVFHEGDAEFWAKNEANAELQTAPGQTYRFETPKGTKQSSEQGEGAPLGVIAIAEACERLQTGNEGTLLKDAYGLVCGSAPGVALASNKNIGVHVFQHCPPHPYDDVAFAPLVEK